MICISNIRELYTMVSEPDNRCGVIKDASLLIQDGRIEWMGAQKDQPWKFAVSRHIDAEQKIIVPGFIDCHTHLIFAGDRCAEFYLRSKGTSYADILKAGGGIVSTMQAVRNASLEELVKLAEPRLSRMLARGVTTIEAKTGYGLSLESELKMLDVMRVLNAHGQVSIMGTFLGAHAFPPEYRERRALYVEHLIQDMLPAVKEHGFATFCDVFVEDGAFSVDDGRRILSRAKELGLLPRVHAEQLSRQGGAQLACEVEALSASHLEHINFQDIQALSNHGVVAEVLPVAQEFLGMKTLAPARQMADAGVSIAIASDFNPGSAMCDDLLLAARLGVTRCGLSCEEALAGITSNAAKALGRTDIGALSVGSRADLCFLNSETPWHFFYDWSLNPVHLVMKAGVIVCAD